MHLLSLHFQKKKKKKKKKNDGDIANTSIHPSVRHTISSLNTGRNSTKLATSLSLMIMVCESNIIFLCVPLSVRASVVRPFVRHTISS